MRNIRYMDKLIDELAKGRPLEKVLRKQTSEVASGVTAFPASRSRRSP